MKNQPKRIIKEDIEHVSGADDNKIMAGDTVIAVEDIEKGFGDGGRTPKIAYKAGTQLTVDSVDRNDNGEYIYVEDDSNEYDAYLFRKVSKVKEAGNELKKYVAQADVYVTGNEHIARHSFETWLNGYGGGGAKAELKSFKSVGGQVKERSGGTFTQPLSCNIYIDKSQGDSPNNIVSSIADSVMLFPAGTTEDDPALQEYLASNWARKQPAVILEVRNIGGREYLSAYPIRLAMAGKREDVAGDGLVKRASRPMSRGMFGGNFIYTSDSRFPNDYPIALHDRVENYKMESKLQEATGKVGVKSIWLKRAEGHTPLPQPVTVSSYAEATKVLQDWARTAPEAGQGYDKTDFKVTFEDGETYDGTLDLKGIDVPNNDTDVAKHIFDFMYFYTGKANPSHMKPQAYRDYIATQGEDSKKNALDFLAKYDLSPYNDKPLQAAEEKPAEEKEKPLKASALEADLERFTGSETWWKNPLFPGYSYTDGVKYLAREANAYWLITDILSTARRNKILRTEPFIVWTLNVKDKKATLTADDGNENILYTKEYDYTDFPLDSVKLYLTNNVLLLPSEN